MAIEEVARYVHLQKENPICSKAGIDNSDCSLTVLVGDEGNMAMICLNDNGSTGACGLFPCMFLQHLTAMIQRCVEGSGSPSPVVTQTASTHPQLKASW